MNARLVVNDWHVPCPVPDIFAQNEDYGFYLSTGALHGGSTFPVNITGLPPDIEMELLDAAKLGAHLIVELWLEEAE